MPYVSRNAWRCPTPAMVRLASGEVGVHGGEPRLPGDGGRRDVGVGQVVAQKRERMTAFLERRPR